MTSHCLTNASLPHTFLERYNIPAEGGLGIQKLETYEKGLSDLVPSETGPYWTINLVMKELGRDVEEGDGTDSENDSEDDNEEVVQ